ncbi:MAG: alpha/beta hydrolase [Lachnospiraceae bacterium]|nr:alpha/beta hydrolase [Lachnospiraceae bacterium]
MNISIQGYNVNYKITGEGERTLVILQGWGTKLEVYDSVAAAVNHGMRVVQFDFPGFGGSDEPRESWGVDEFADFFTEFMKALEIKEATLLGHSFGGRIIIKLANRENLPFTITNIIFVDAAGIRAKLTGKQKRKQRRYKILKKILLCKPIHAMFPELIDDWKSKQGSADYRNATPRMRECMVKSINEDLTDLLPGIRQEVLLIWGDNDTATPLADAKKMEAMIPNNGLVVLSPAGHYSFLDQPAVFRNVMRSYLKPGEQAGV